MDFIAIIKDIGFPMAVCVGLFYIIHKGVMAIIEGIKNSLIPCIGQFTNALSDVTKTLSKIDQTLDRNNMILIKLAEQLDCDDLVQELLDSKRNKEKVGV
jgi:hypothetical protein